LSYIFVADISPYQTTNRKPICDFLLMINTNLHPISHRFQDIADYSSNFRLTGVPVFNTLVWGES